MMKKSTEGFTLLELVVGILCATLITGAAMSLMLMGLRNAQSLTDANTNLQNSRIILTMVEQLASEGKIQKIDITGNGDTPRNWYLLDENDDTIISYDAERQAIYTGEPPASGAADNPLMEGVISSAVTLSSAELGGCKLNFSIATDDGRFDTVIYCRAADYDVEIFWPDESTDSEADRVIFAPDVSGTGDTSSATVKFDGTITGGRTAFLSTLLTQYGSRGEIIGDSGYFSTWYEPSWPPLSTPWCACFVSWGADFIDKAGVFSEYIGTAPHFANVDCGWNQWNDIEHKQYKKMFDRQFLNSQVLNGQYTPCAGDLIFFDWENDSPDDYIDTKLDHVGVVLYLDEDFVYTIEGNSDTVYTNSDGKVAIQRYLLNSDYIHGYAVLDWVAGNE